MSKELALPIRESIMAAAKRCPDAYTVLEALFPTVFQKKEEMEFQVGDIVKHNRYGLGIYKMTDDPWAGVEFFAETANFHDLRGQTHNKHGYWVRPSCLHLHYRPK